LPQQQQQLLYLATTSFLTLARFGDRANSVGRIAATRFTSDRHRIAAS